MLYRCRRSIIDGIYTGNQGVSLSTSLSPSVLPFLAAASTLSFIDASFIPRGQSFKGDSDGEEGSVEGRSEGKSRKMINRLV